MMTENPLVTICPVVPYPPSSGGKKRTLRLLEAAERSGLTPHLLTTDGSDPGAAAALRERGWVVEVLEEPGAGLSSRLAQHLHRLPSPFLPAIDRRLRELLAERPALVQVEHAQSAYYGEALRGVPWIFSLHNVDSELMRTIARSRRRGTVAWLRDWTRWRATARVERRAAPEAAAVVCVSAADTAALEALSPHVVTAPNGVDDEFFTVEPELPEAPTVVFFGQLDYPPNAHGIVRFLREGWPLVRAANGAASLRVLGGGASPELRAMSDPGAGIEIVGFAEDLLAELAAARLSVVPLWAGGGTRLKVLESLAAARPVVGTPLGVEGLGFESGRHGLEAADPVGLGEAVLRLLADPTSSQEMGLRGRAHAEAYRWQRALAPVEQVYRELSATI